MKNIPEDLIDTLVTQWQQEQPSLDAAAMQVVGRVLKLGKVLEKRAGQALKESGIYYTDLDVLATLRRSGVLITSGAMTALLDRLTKLKLIYRSTDPKDGRIKRAGLTEQGKVLIDKAITIRFQEAKDSVSGLSQKEQRILSDLLKKMLFTIEN